jgi:amino-acid N-acetyltransferase
MNIDRASADDAPAIRALLETSGLPVADLTPALLEGFLVARASGGLVAVGGLEWTARSEVLLRSVAVARSARGTGAGRAMVAALEDHARRRGAQAIYLLTATAERYFAAQGYKFAARAHAPPGIRQTAQFGALCPASSAFMVKVVETV